MPSAEDRGHKHITRDAPSSTVCQYKGTQIPRETLMLIPKLPAHFNSTTEVKTA